jgi:hypothetical protein
LPQSRPGAARVGPVPGQSAAGPVAPAQAVCADCLRHPGKDQTVAPKRATVHHCGMSRILINRYLADLDRTKRFFGSLTEEVIPEAFKTLLRDASRDRNLFLQAEYSMQGPQKNTLKLDGAVLHELRVPLGYREAKDIADDLDRAIEKKLRKGYPQDNILFEDRSHLYTQFIKP